ncbi:helix-turn-helix domain-containing protein [Blautia sp. MSJ-19]|uniref:helix-turn-helix domain-containing protein n=1 Tax=Blautia sp. MSJ-19 TaxID=2841517 RepID=UPI001C0EAB38|nr:helix-turn-helix domain-containing protein [Blautia sp. MSJ-19]MBU5479838.1 helix-turn-helix domain-containing protein [Blautia sp. MSJ-19]
MGYDKTAILLFKEGDSIEKLAEVIQTKKEMVHKWITEYNEKEMVHKWITEYNEKE